MNKYSKLTAEQLEEHFANYLIDSWSYSKVTTFSRNEKDFEMQYIYGEGKKQSASSIAGKAYHAALEKYFTNKKNHGYTMDMVELEQLAFAYIENTPADVWKLQKTNPTVTECLTSCMKSVSQFLNNFLSEIQVYESEIAEILGIEERLVVWIKVNGVDIPLPCHLVIDLIIRTKDGKIVVIDHKSKKSFTDDGEIKFVIGKQAITYTLGYEEAIALKVDEVWFIENKGPKNKDNSAQVVPFKCIMDHDTRRLYEALLYEPLKRMIEAVNNPDYLYLINDSDNMTDKAELYAFWAKTMLAELDGFNIPDNKKPMIAERLRKIRNSELATASPNVIKNFKKFAAQFIPYDLSNKDMTNQQKIEHVLKSFNLMTEVRFTFEGYSSISYLVEVGAGVSISSIQKFRLDIANALNVSNVRIQKDLVVYEGKSYLSIESSRKTTDTLIWDASMVNGNKVPLGIDNFKQPVIWDMDNNSTPHMLVCGATGSGKSVFLNSTINFAKDSVSEVYIFDPKYEFTEYKSTPGFTVVNDIEDIETQLGILVLDMEKRVKAGQSQRTLVVFDEFADAVANSRKGNELNNYKDIVEGQYKNGEPKMKRIVGSVDRSLEENLRVLLQKGRSSGFRIIAATQRASTKVITGDAKVNFPVQVCFRVPKDIDSIVVIDEPGAEALNGRGDGLIKSPEYLGVVRFQAFYKAS